MLLEAADDDGAADDWLLGAALDEACELDLTLELEAAGRLEAELCTLEIARLLYLVLVLALVLVLVVRLAAELLAEAELSPR